MKLKQKEFIKADGTVIKLTSKWISSKLGEVYELSHLDKIDQERLHYGYMTEALVSFLETTDEKGVPFFERVELKSIDVGNNRICNLLNQKVILDKPSKIERENSNVSLHHSAVRLSKDQNIGIKGNGSINICDSICEIHDFVSNDGGLYVSQKGKRIEDYLMINWNFYE